MWDDAIAKSTKRLHELEDLERARENLDSFKKADAEAILEGLQDQDALGENGGELFEMVRRVDAIQASIP